MSAIRQLFEKELKNKLALKSSGHVSDETVLLKAFKYFDLDNSGHCSKEEYLRTINKIGITGFTDKNLLDLFDIYDTDGSGNLDYKEFVGQLFGNTSISRKVENNERGRPEIIQQETKGSKKQYLNQENVQAILEKVRAKLIGRGVRGIISLGRAFKIMDDDRSHNLSIFEFKKAAKDYRFDLSDQEVEIAFLAFDRNNSGNIDYEDFLRTVRGNMNGFRAALVEQAFNLMDKDRSGFLDINDIKGVYNARMHPEVKQGKKTEEEVLLEFLETFEQHHNLVAGEKSDNVISKEEWFEYYENISMSIDDDAYFEVMMNNCWRMNKNTTYNNEKKGWSNKEENSNGNLQQAYGDKKRDVTPVRGKVIEESPVKKQAGGNSLVDKFREKILSRGGRGIIGLARQFKIFDDDNSKSLVYDEFAKAVKDFKIDLSSNEIKVLFGIFDRDGTGTIDYDEFLRQVRGEMNDRRKKIVMQAYDKLDTDKSGVVDINDIKYVYNVKNHPEVKNKKKTEDEVYGEFLETFEAHHNINKGTRDKRVTKEEFIEYYNNISMSVDNDEHFELIIINAWKLGGSANYAKGEMIEVKGDNKRGNLKSAQVYQNAPWGTSDEPTNYGTSLRPQQVQNNFSKLGDEVLLKFREKLASRGTRGIMGIRRSFKIADDDNSHEINLNEFSKLVKDYRIALNDQEIKKLFSIFDVDKSGHIDYDEFVKGVVGEMNEFRKGLVKKAFTKLDNNKSGHVDLDDLRGVYNAKQHPDVKLGKKTEDEVLAEFLDNFEYHFSILNDKKTKDRTISLDEFIEYYNNISMSIEDDKYFEVMINNAWNLDGNKPNYGKGWKGEI